MFNAGVGDLLGPFPSSDRSLLRDLPGEREASGRAGRATPRPRCGGCCARTGCWRGRRNTSSKPARAERRPHEHGIERSIPGGFPGLGGGAVAVHAPRDRATGRARGIALLLVRRNRLQCRRSGRGPVRDQVGLRPHLHRGARQGNQHGGAQGRATCSPRSSMLREYRHESSVRASAKSELLFIPRKVILPIIAGNAAAQAFIASYVAISSAGGFVGRLFDLRGKVGKTELEEFIRSVGVKRVERRQGDPEAGLARGPAALRGAPRRSADRATRGRHRVSAGHAAAGRDLRREGLPDAPGAVGVGDRDYRHRAAGHSREDGSLHPRAQPEAAGGAGGASPVRRAGAAAAEEAGGATQPAGPSSICSPSRSSARRSSSASPWSSRPRRWIAARPAWR